MNMEQPASTPTLITARLVMRPFNPGDCHALHRIMVEPGMMRYFANPEPPQFTRVQTLIERQMTHWAERGYGWWALELPETSKLIGWCGLQYLPETDENEVGYLLAKPHWGKGLATEAGLMSLDFGFTKLNFKEIIGITHPDNIASQRVLEKLGLSSPKEAFYFGMDCLRFEITRQKYFSTKPGMQG